MAAVRLAHHGAVASAPARRLLQFGLERHRAGDLPEAETWFRRAVMAAPDEPTALFLLGLVRFEAGDPGEAIRLIESVVALRPAHVEAWLALASVRQHAGDATGAARAFREVTLLAPDHADALLGLSQALLASGDGGAAVTAGERAAAAAPGSAAARLALGAALAALDRRAEAAQAYRAATVLAPDHAAAHISLAVELLQIGQAEAAAPIAERGVTLDPTSAFAWFVLGSALRRISQPEPAAAALERCLELNPDHRIACLTLGLTCAEMDRPAQALRRLRRAVELDPDDAEAHAHLSTVYCSVEQFELGHAHALRALELDPDMAAPHQNLARILAREGRHDEARPHRDFAYRVRNLIVAEAHRPRQRVLVLSTTDLGNTPERHLLPADRYTRLFWFVEYATDGQALALDYDVVFNAIGDHDETGQTAPKVAAFLQTNLRPLINHPDRIALTCRHLAPARLGDIDGLVVPRTARIEAPALAGMGLAEAARRAGVRAPFIARPTGSHGGERLMLVTTKQNLAPPASTRDHYLTEFHDCRSVDGLFRKFRMIFVDRTPYPYHLAIGPSWIVHYESSGTAAHPERVAEERRFLEDPEGVMGRPAMAAVRAVGRRLDLDFAGMDFSVLGDGRVLFFEANATMLVHPEDPAGPLAHKNPHVERIVEAFQQRLLEA